MFKCSGVCLARQNKTAFLASIDVSVYTYIFNLFLKLGSSAFLKLRVELQIKDISWPMSMELMFSPSVILPI